MSIKPKPTGISTLSGLLRMMGFSRRDDPFGQLLEQERANSGWFHAVIDSCLEHEACLFCEVSQSSLSNYLFWLPVNLRDAGFIKSLYTQGGFCPFHLKLVMLSLRDFPYSQVRFFMLLKQLLEKGVFPSKYHCHLCATLKGSLNAYRFAIDSLLNSPEESRRAETLVSNLCCRHAEYLRKDGCDDTREHEDNKRISAEEKRLWKAELLKTIGEISEEFHRMSSEELRRKLMRCETMVLKAIKESER